MARPLRIEFPGAVYHVTARGNSGQDIFNDDVDREAFYGVLLRAVERYRWRIHAWCLMTNHYHLLLETPDPNLSRGMRHLNGVYTQKVNRRHGKSGHVFQGRFKGILVEKESHLAELCRYIVLNPVRAGMVAEPGAYRWSSYLATAGTAPVPEFLTTDWILNIFGTHRKSAQKKYQDFIFGGIGKETGLWAELKGQIVLGSDEFARRVWMHLEDGERNVDVPKEQWYAGRPALQILFGSKGRKEDDLKGAAFEALRRYGYTQKEIAAHMGVHHTTVSRWIREREQS